MNAYALDDLIDDRPDEGVFRISRSMFNDPDLFELELEHIFESGWLFVGVSTQAPTPGDYFTTRIGRVPVLISRDPKGVLRCFVNSCPHKGARICAEPSGNARLHVCPYHSWTFDSGGKNRGIKWEKSGGYSTQFQQEDHNLIEVGAFEDYRGFLFASFRKPALALSEYLGEARHMLDLIADQSEDGFELIPGRVRFTYAANWKMQLENCSDQYHFSSTHPSYIRILEQRAREKQSGVIDSTIEGASFMNEDSESLDAGSFSFDHGHALTWAKLATGPSLPLYERFEELGKRVGPVRRDWMFQMRNLTIFPNMQIVENASSQLRVIHPLAHNLTEMQTWCLAPKGESAAARRQRIRQYEDFFNPTGMATPDDTAVYEECQTGMTAQGRPWLQGYSRGLSQTSKGGNQFSEMIDMTPAWNIAGPAQLCDETLIHSYYRAWRSRLGEVLA